MGELDQIAEPHLGAPDNVRGAGGQPSAVGQQGRAVGQPVRLANRGVDPPARPVILPIEPQGEPHPVLNPVVTREPVEREQVGIFQIDRAGIFVGHFKVLERGAGDNLKARGKHLRAAHEAADQRPFGVKRQGRQPARLPARIAAIDEGRGQRVLVRMIDIAPRQRGERHVLSPRGNSPQVPLGRGKGALGVLPAAAGDRQRVDLQLHAATKHRIGQAAAIVEHWQGHRDLALGIADPQGLGRPAGQREVRIRIDPFQIDGRTQTVIAAEVIAPQEGAV